MGQLGVFSSVSTAKSSNGIGGGVVARVYPIHAIMRRTPPTASKAETFIVTQPQGDMNRR